MGLLGFYFLPTGRIPRNRFWLGFIGLLLIEVAFNIWIGMTLLGQDYLSGQEPNLTKSGFQLSLLINLIFSFPLFVIFAKRFHDRGRSAIWTLPYLLVFLASIASIVVGWMTVDPKTLEVTMSRPGELIGIASLLVQVWIFVELGCLRGTDGPNKFGPDPLAR